MYSQKLNKQSQYCPFNSVQVKIREGSPEGTRVWRKGFVQEMSLSLE